jgi:hypothetical protein
MPISPSRPYTSWAGTRRPTRFYFPCSARFEEGGFQGRGPNGKAYDWKAWDGTPHGYEGLLVDGYQALLAVLSR